MKTIILKPLAHRGARQSGIYFPYDTMVKEYVKQFEGVKWSQSHGVFYVNDNSDNR